MRTLNDVIYDKKIQGMAKLLRGMYGEDTLVRDIRPGHLTKGDTFEGQRRAFSFAFLFGPFFSFEERY